MFVPSCDTSLNRESSNTKKNIVEDSRPADRRSTSPEAKAELSRASIMIDSSEPPGKPAATGMAGVRGKIVKYDVLSEYYLLCGCNVFRFIFVANVRYTQLTIGIAALARQAGTSLSGK